MAHSLPTLTRPIFIASAPRSGSTLLFELVRRLEPVWSLPREDHQIVEGVSGLHPGDRHWSSNRLVGEDIDEATAGQLRRRFAAGLLSWRGEPLADLVAPDHRSIRLLDKLPKNSLRISALRRVFPDALVVYLYRDPAESVGSLIDGWLSGQFVTYPNLPGWGGPPWSFLLPPGWQALRGAVLAEVAGFQWAAANHCIMHDLAAIPVQDWLPLDYRALVESPAAAIDRIREFAGCHWTDTLAAAVTAPLPLSRFTLSPPSPTKWHRHPRAIGPWLERLEPVEQRSRALVAGRPGSVSPITSQIR